MIELTSITFDGTTESGQFHGSLKLDPGLNVISAKNAYGKTLAMVGIPWCLGLEPMFGLQNNDSSRFPSALRDMVKLGSSREVQVTSSSVCLSMKRDDGALLSISRQIKGSNLEVVEVVERGEQERRSTLRARQHTMADETGGLQRFLFEWMGLPHTQLMTLKGVQSELYLENLAPLFYVDQSEGWTDLQALQVYRYQIQEVAEAAVEYLLGAEQALSARLLRQQVVSTNARLKSEAEALAAQVAEFFRANGWTLNLSTHGSPADIAKRWAKRSLSKIAREDFNMDAAAERIHLDAVRTALQSELTSEPVGGLERGPASQASQQTIELKTRRHELREMLRVSLMQLEEQSNLLRTIEHRMQSTKDVLRLKTQGIGRLNLVECPTCHRELDHASFELTEQSAEAVEAHIETLTKQRLALRNNIVALEAQITRLNHELALLEEQLLAANRVLDSVNLSLGSGRERLAKVALELSVAERKLETLSKFTEGLAAYEARVSRWLEAVTTATEEYPNQNDLPERLRVFTDKFRDQLIALGHSAVTRATSKNLAFDERYVPYLGSRRLRSLGSASDHPRLVAAYVLALAEASREKKGPHPGFILLDEPLQQNPDLKHRNLMLNFFEQTASTTKNQVIVTTSLDPEELTRLRKARVHVNALSGDQFLKLVRPVKEGTEPRNQKAEITKEETVAGSKSAPR